MALYEPIKAPEGKQLLPMVPEHLIFFSPPLVIKSIDEVSRRIESPYYAEQFFFDKHRYVPQVDWSDPSNFARFGSAEQYYVKAIENIYRFYPYDGSLREKLEWHNQSSYFDNYVFEYEYPRTNGYIEIGETWGPSAATKTPAGGPDTYKKSSTPQYISVKGGPHAASIPTYASGTYDKKLSFKEKEQKANVYDVENNQMQNFTIDGVKGNTVEFWMKLPLEPSKSQTSPSHAYFDLWNGEPINTNGYGRFLIETRYDTSNAYEGDYVGNGFFHITYMSGTDGVLRAKIGDIALSGAYNLDLSDWNHWAFTVENHKTPEKLEIKLYANGNLIETTLTGTIIQTVKTGSFNANIGAYKHSPDTDSFNDGVSEGYGSISGSFIDEFRFWKIHRDSDDIKFNWFKQVAGGTNTDYGDAKSKFYRDINPVNLGVYFKFNEGITTSDEHDRITIDYSGRVSNGFISNYTAAMRYTGSAIVEKAAAPREFRDPIIYKFHPDVVAYEQSSSYKGREYDTRNSMYMFNMLPSWIIEEDEFKGRNQSLYLNQIMASYLDNLYLQIEKYPTLKNMDYVSGSVSGSMNKPLPFADRLLSNTGYVVPEIFANSNVFESLGDRNDVMQFERKLSDIKNQIYSNIYNNLLSINKSKGTVKSITNMMRCFGVDDDLYSINFYADNAKLDLKGNFIPKTIRKSYADFSTSDKFQASVYQMTQSSNPNSVSFITGSNKINTEEGWDWENGFTVESEVIFPKYPKYGEPNFKNYNFPYHSASLFGMHDAGFDAGNDMSRTTWDSDDFSNFQVYAAREKANNAENESRNVRFVLKSYKGYFGELITDVFENVYNNERWNFAVRVYPDKYPNVGWVSGSEDSNLKIRFSGYNLVGDTIQNSFDLHTTVGAEAKKYFLSRNKRIYVGAHRTDFVDPEGLREPTNVKISSCRYWGTFLNNDELYSHALDPKNYGVYNPMENTYLLQDGGSVAATATINTTTPIVFTSTAGGSASSRNGKKIKIVVVAPQPNPTDTVIVNFTEGTGGSAKTIIIKVQPNDGTNNGSTAVNLTTAELVQLVNNGSVVGKNITITLGNDLRVLQTATGGDATNLADGGEGDDEEGTFSGGLSTYPVDLPKAKSLLMNWDFDNITGSSTSTTDPVLNGVFSVDDFTSGSSQDIYGTTLSDAVEKQHTGRGVFFPAGTNNTSSISREYVYSYRQQVPENLNNLNAIKVLSRDDEFFTKRTRPVTFSMTIEKSMYQNISEEMINFLAASQEASALESLIGQPVSKYRDRYKRLEKIRNIFFSRVNNTPDVDRYLEYFKWLDTSISTMVQQVVPASSGFSSVRNIIESHTFERSGKYKHKFPTLEIVRTKIAKLENIENKFKFNHAVSGQGEGTFSAAPTPPVSAIRPLASTNVSLSALRNNSLNSWRHNHAALDASGELDETKSIWWWSNRVQFSGDTVKTSGISNVDTALNLAFDSFNSSVLSGDIIYGGEDVASNIPIAKNPSTTVKSAVSYGADLGETAGVYQDQLRSRPKKDINFRNVVFNESPEGSGNRLVFNTNTLHRQPNTTTFDEIDPNRKFKPEFDITIPSISTIKGFDGRKYSPLSFQSSSTNNPYVTGSSPWYIGYELSTQHLQDYYLQNKDVPMQGPFTEQNVGGYAYRHGGIMVEPPQAGAAGFRAEGWYASRSITANPNGIQFDFYNPFDLPAGGGNYPRARYTRDQIAKRPLNIRNIKSTTVSFLPQRTDIPPVNELGSTKVSIGNYEKDYQIVQISSRDANNRYFVDNDGISTASAPSVGTPSVSGAYDRSIPDRGKNEHIFVSRFSAPGGPEINGQAFLNYESEVYSPYNAMTFRNLSVRQPLKTLLTRHTAFGGYDSTISGNGTAATAAITCPTPGSLLGGASFTLQNSVGVITTYIINGGGSFATQPGGTAGTSIQVFFGGASTTAHVVEAVRKAINATFNAKMSAVDTDSTTVTVTQQSAGVNGNKNNTAGSSGLTVPNFTGGVDRLASYHKTQRNARKYIEYTDIFETAATRSAYDNYYVQHQIPQSDMQYAWITASATNVIHGFEQPNYENASYASTDITFATASDFGAFINTSDLPNGKYIFGRPASSGGSLFLPQDFIGLNNFGYFDSDEMDNNTLLTKLNTDFVGATIVGGTVGFGTPIERLNAQLLKGNGPYGQSSWKQIQNSYHPIVRYMKSINRFSILTEKTSVSPGDAKQQFIKTQTLENFTEPMISFKYKPLEHDVIVSADDGSEYSMEIDSTYSNFLSGFANNKLNDLTFFVEDLKTLKLTYNSLKSIYMKDDIPDEFSPIKSLKKLSYREVIYPRERNTGLGKTRGRENYTVSSGSSEFNVRLGDSVAFWKNNINDRLRSDAEARNAQGLIIASGSSYFGLTDMSIWPLDSEEPFFDLYQISSSDNGGGSFDAFYWAPLSPSSSTGTPLGGLDPNSTERVGNLNKNGELSYAGYIYSLFGINLQGKVRQEGAPTASGPLPNFLGNGVPSEDGLNFKPTASFQYEYPNMMMSGAMVGRGASPSASLHLMAPYRTDVLSGKTPWFNSYEDYSEDIRRIAKDYTVLPEFRISDHIEYYLDQGFFADNNKFLDIIGSSLENTASATSETGSFQADFFKIYSHSDFMKHFSVIQEDHKENNTAFASKLRLEANAVKKLLPYQGFYPALRSVQLGQLFSSSYSPFISGSNNRGAITGDTNDSTQERLMALYQPFFAPGIFFNTIKSGIAVNYPVHTASAPQVDNSVLNVTQPTSGSTFISNYYTTTPNYSFPFEAILDPDQFLPVSSSLTSSTESSLSSSVFFVYPNFTGSINAGGGGSAFFDNFYVAQTVQFPYTPLAPTVSGSQPQFFFTWSGQSDPKYSLASSNFFAESVNFFLERGTLTSFISKPEKDFKSMISGSTYYMDVILYKTENFVSYEGPPTGTFKYDGGLQLDGTLSSKHFYYDLFGDGIVNTSIGARGMHYGPAYKTSPLIFGSSGTGSVPYASFRAQDPAYAPHTPPYFYGTSRARIAFKPHKARDMVEGEAAKFTLEEILSNAKVETVYENDNEMSKTLQENQYRNNSAAGQGQMQISSSINLFGQTTLKEIQYGTERNPDGTFKAERATTPIVQGTNDAWIIETKFECPSINMANMDTASLGAGIGDGKEKYHTRGIWKGYGEYPTGSEGLFLQLKESYPQVINDIGGDNSAELTGSLIDVCGFRASKEKVGKIRSKKMISEAIIAVPIDEKGNFIPINPEMFAKQKSNYQTKNKALLAGDFGIENDIAETSITDMIEKMKKFSLPPQMDFLNNRNIDPFVMYIFDFTHALDRQDLVDIWQNLMPNISRTAEKQIKAIEHGLGVNYEFFGQFKQGKLPTNTRWMVFKVKQKARNNFFNVTQQSEVAKGFTFTALNELEGFSSNPEAELPFSYNWPYDFFSLVELAQVESEISFEPPEE